MKISPLPSSVVFLTVQIDFLVLFFSPSVYLYFTYSHVGALYERSHAGCVCMACLVHTSHPLLFQFGLWDSLDGYSGSSKRSLSSSCRVQLLRYVCADFIHLSKSLWHGWCYTASLTPAVFPHLWRRARTWSFTHVG